MSRFSLDGGPRFLWILMLLSLAFPAHAEPTFPWKAGDKPPKFMGVALGDKMDRVLKVLGEPDARSDMGQNVTLLLYKAKGGDVIVSQADGASVISARSSPAGDLGGLRIGASRDAIIGKWGKPHAAKGPLAIYTAGVWSVAVKLDESGARLVDMSLAWNASKWADELKKTDPGQIKVLRPK